MEYIHIYAVVIGMLVNVIALVGGIIKLSAIARHVERTFDYFALEHEMLMQWYAKTNGITLAELPTRLGKAPWFQREE